MYFISLRLQVKILIKNLIHKVVFDSRIIDKTKFKLHYKELLSKNTT